MSLISLRWHQTQGDHPDPNLTMAEELHDWIRKLPGSSAWTSSTSDGRITNLNSGNQGDLFTGVGGDVFKDVGGDVIKHVHVYDNYISGEKMIRLRKFVVLKSKYEGKCLRLTENDGSLPTGFLKFEGSEVATEQAKFELELSKSGNGLVHLRCCYNNKYLVRSTYWYCLYVTFDCCSS